MPPETIQVPLVDYFGHPVEVDQQAEKDLVGSRAVFVDPSEVTVNRDTGDIFAVKGKYARGLGTQADTVDRGNLAVNEFVVRIVRRGDFR